MEEMIELAYLNEKRLGFNDFMKFIKPDLLYNISKNSVYNAFIGFEICYTNNNYYDENGDNTFYFSFTENINDFDFIGLYTDEFNRELFYQVNKECYLWLKTNFIGDGVIDYGDEDVVDYYDKDCDDVKDLIIDSFEVIIYADSDKVEHKNKFHKDLHNDLMVVAWRPDRVLDWCLDFEELRDLKKRWSID